MNIEVRLGTNADVESLAILYDELLDYLEETINYPGWKKGVYPVKDDAMAGVEAGTLYVATHENEIIGSMILRHECEGPYQTAPWRVQLSEEKVFVIHTFVVSPQYLSQGVGQKLLTYAMELARKNGVKALRLDVYEKNEPAIRLYEKVGFQWVTKVSLGLECYGLDWFMLYEMVV